MALTIYCWCEHSKLEYSLSAARMARRITVTNQDKGIPMRTLAIEELEQVNGGGCSPCGGSLLGGLLGGVTEGVGDIVEGVGDVVGGVVGTAGGLLGGLLGGGCGCHSIKICL